MTRPEVVAREPWRFRMLFAQWRKLQRMSWRTSATILERRYIAVHWDLLVISAARKLLIPKQTAETQSAGAFEASSAVPAFEIVTVKRSRMLCWIQTGIARLVEASAIAASVGSGMGAAPPGSLCTWPNTRALGTCTLTWKVWNTNLKCKHNIWKITACLLLHQASLLKFPILSCGWHQS